MSFRYSFIVPALSLLCCAGCDQAPVAPSSASSAASQPQVTATYVATLTASSSCADRLPADVRTRTYTAMFYSDGRIAWTGRTVQPPPGHQIVSSEQMTGDSFSLVIGTKEDPQSDAFHGITDVVSPGGLLNISGTGSGTVQGSRITGTFAGNFNYYQQSPGGTYEGTYCGAADHQFTFVLQDRSGDK